MSIPIYLGLIASLWTPKADFGDLKDLLINGAISLVIMLFFASAAYVMRLESEKTIEIQSLNDELNKSKDELEETNKKLMVYAKNVENITVLSERNRLAGEIHDKLGHHLTALIIEIGICSKLVDRDAGRTKIELEKASMLTQNALSEVRRYVRAIKPSDIEGLTGIRALEELARYFQKSTMTHVKLSVSEQQYMLPPSVDVAIYNTVQEALTNCVKHGQADTVSIDLYFRKNSIELVIKDNGKGCDGFTKGIGLKTMEERICTLGGRIDFSGSNGFLINVAIPVEVV